jgi:6-phosphogluconolactonase (cycloisomerase 2 family)
MKILRYLATSLLALFAALPLLSIAQGADDEYILYVGTYTATASKGIYAFRFQPSTAKLTPLGVVAETPNPSFLATSPDHRFLYAVNENGRNSVEGGTVSAFAIDPHTAQLTFLNKVSSRGETPAHLTVDAGGKTVLVANYGNGTFAAFPIGQDGRLGEATSVNQHTGPQVPQHTGGPHAHAVLISPDQRIAFVADLGLDRVYTYRFDASKHTFALNDPAFVTTSPGAGPRHFALHPNGRFLYANGETDSTVTVFSYQSAGGTLKELQTVSTLPPDFKGRNTTAEIQIDHAGKFLYVSNRGQDSIAVFAVDSSTGMLTPVEHVSTQGMTPRNFSLDPTGAYLFAANQNSNNVVLFRVDAKTGRLSPTGQVLDVPSPSCVIFMKASNDARPAQKTAVPRSALYAAVGSELTEYDIDIDNAALIKQGSVMLPANVQEAWPHPSKKYLYVAWSNGGASNSSSGGAVPKGDQHGLSAFRIDRTSGALLPHGKPAALPSRPIFITTDVDGTHVLAAYNDPSGLTVHRILPDGTIGAQVQLTAPLDVGIYGHQIRVDPSNKAVILVTRGNGPTSTKPEDPGALKIFNFKNGVLSNRVSIAPGGGYNFQVRHLDFHPSRPWVFVTLERQNKLQVYRRTSDGTLGDSPLFTKDTLTEPGSDRSGQAVASVHVHPNGRFVYVANRASGTVDVEGKRVFAGGENSIAVFAINQETGEPTLIQSIDTRGFHPRTFALDRSGSILAVANQMSLLVRDGAGTKTVPATLSIFRVGADGTLSFARKYDIETGGSRSLFWTGIVSIP